MKRIVRLFTVDTARPRRPFFDEILNAIPPGKALCSGTVWRGELSPFVDSVASALTSSFAAPGLTTGHVLHAEPAPTTLDLGRRWVGDLHRRLVSSIDTTLDPRLQPVDVGEVLGAVERLRDQMGTGNPAMVSDAVRRLRDAAARVTDSLRAKRTGDARRHVGDFSKPKSIAEINAANHAFNAGRNAPSLDANGRMSWRPGVADTALRDAVHDAASAKTPRALIGSLNRAARAFWAGR